MEREIKAVEITITNRDAAHLKKGDVAAIAITAGGGMGTPGKIVVYHRQKDKIIIAKGNYVYGDIDMDLLNERLGCFGKNDADWKEFYIGCGNTLLVNSVDYPELARKFEGKCDDEIGVIHYAEIVKALSGGDFPRRK